MHGSRTEVLSGQQPPVRWRGASDEVGHDGGHRRGWFTVDRRRSSRRKDDLRWRIKESLVTCGRLFMDEVNAATPALPVDSEHNAISEFAAIWFSIIWERHLEQNGVTSILLTGLVARFVKTPMCDLAAMTPDQACRHPNWSMGENLRRPRHHEMNKGLEALKRVII